MFLINASAGVGDWPEIEVGGFHGQGRISRWQKGWSPWGLDKASHTALSRSGRTGRRVKMLSSPSPLATTPHRPSSLDSSLGSPPTQLLKLVHTTSVQYIRSLPVVGRDWIASSCTCCCQGTPSRKEQTYDMLAFSLANDVSAKLYLQRARHPG